MHLIIDIRIPHPVEAIYREVALEWVSLWRRYHPHDRITYITLPGDEVPGEDSVVVKYSWWRSSMRIGNDTYTPDRVISFSPLPALDPSLPTIIHVGDLRERLYGESQWRGLERWFYEYQSEKKYKRAHAIIVPYRELSHDITELYDVDEEKIHILPYVFDLRTHKSEGKNAALTYNLSDEYFIVEGTPTDEWQPIELIQAFGHYIHDRGGHGELVILGDLGDNFGIIASLVRGLDLIKEVKILGSIDREERESIYLHASGFVAVGRYASRVPAIALAESYNLPLYLSDIPGQRDYHGILMHPRDIEKLPEFLIEQEKGPRKRKSFLDLDQIMGLYGRIISS